MLEQMAIYMMQKKKLDAGACMHAEAMPFDKMCTLKEICCGTLKKRGGIH